MRESIPTTVIPQRNWLITKPISSGNEMESHRNGPYPMSSQKAGLLPFAEFVGGQASLFGTVPFAVFVWAIRHRRRLLADPRLAGLCVPVRAAVRVLPVQGHARAASKGTGRSRALACWPLAAEWYRRVRGRRAGAGRRGPASRCRSRASAFFLVHLIEPFRSSRSPPDRMTRQWEDSGGRGDGGGSPRRGSHRAGLRPDVSVDVGTALAWHRRPADRRRCRGRATSPKRSRLPAAASTFVVFAEAPFGRSVRRLGPPLSPVLSVRRPGEPGCPCGLDYSDPTNARRW